MTGLSFGISVAIQYVEDWQSTNGREGPWSAAWGGHNCYGKTSEEAVWRLLTWMIENGYLSVPKTVLTDLQRY